MYATALTTERVLVVPGHPLPKGSLKCVGRNGRHQIIDDNPNTRVWLDQVAESAAQQLQLTLTPHQGVGIEIACILPRPASHHRTGRNRFLLRANAPELPVLRQTGDVDKLARLVLDALQSAGVLADDSQVIELTVRKAYGIPGIIARLYPLPPAEDW